jgi:hypothetical protein
VSFLTTKDVRTHPHPSACHAAEHGARVAALVLLRDGRLATACHDRQLRIWCLRTFRLLQAVPDASDTPMQARTRARARAWSALSTHIQSSILCPAGLIVSLLGLRQGKDLPLIGRLQCAVWQMVRRVYVRRPACCMVQASIPRCMLSRVMPSGRAWRTLQRATNSSAAGWRAQRGSGTPGSWPRRRCGPWRAMSASCCRCLAFLGVHPCHAHHGTVMCILPVSGRNAVACRACRICCFACARPAAAYRATRFKRAGMQLLRSI